MQMNHGSTEERAVMKLTQECPLAAVDAAVAQHAGDEDHTGPSSSSSFW